MPNNSGSSPRVRGTDNSLHICLEGGRFIPACAGNRVFDISEIGIGTVHPRVCGEQVTPVVAGSVITGSSPRVRGTGV